MTVTRRDLLKASAATAAFHIVPRHVLGGPGYTPPSEMVTVGLVGAGGRGFRNVKELLKLDNVRIDAVCDPAEHWDLKDFYYKGVAGRLPVTSAIEKHYSNAKHQHKCNQFEDFRKLLDSPSAPDAILCATPDHMHATISLAAMRAGKHVYCEKPLTHNVAEARLVSKVAKESGVATQMGNQGHSSDGIRETVEWIQSGVIGLVREVHAWVPATRWNPTLSGRPEKSMRTPKGLNWDLWLGPREPVPFHSAYAPVSWRDFWDYGLGAMGDFGCHDLDSAVWALGLPAPSKVEMFPAGKMNDEIIPFGEIGYFHFDGGEGRPAVDVTWYSGGPRPPKPDSMPADKQLPSRGVLFVGEKGEILCGGSGGKPQIVDPKLAADSTPPKPTIRRSNGHHRDWIDAIKSGPKASSNFEIGAHLTEITLLGVAALRLRKEIQYDAATMKITNTDGDRIINGDYRKGWELT